MQTAYFLFAFIAVLALIGVAAWLVRRFGTNRLGTNTNRGRMPRLAVIDAAAVDGRRRLVLVRRDNVEHLLMIGGPSDIVVEPNIVRAMPGRDQMAPRPAVGGEQPPRIAPLPDAGWQDDGARDPFDHAEPQMPEPPPRSARPAFADEVRRPSAPPPPPMAERRGDRGDPRSDPRNDPRNDPLAGFTAEPMAGRPEARPEPVPPRMARTEPLMPRPQRVEPPKAPPPVRAPERAAAPPPPPVPPPPSNADQNLAEMAQRLEAALRRPAEPMVAPPVAPEPPPARPSRSEIPAPAPAPQKSGFENLEDEMASLLGRPKSPS